MRLILTILIATFAVACANTQVGGPNGQPVVPGPLGNLKLGAVTSVHATYQARIDPPVRGPDDIVITCSDCRQQYRYVRCTMVSPAIDEFVQIAGLAQPLATIGPPAEMLYILDVELAEGSPLTGFLFASGEIQLADNGPPFGSGQAYLLDQAALKSMLALIKGPKWTCDKTIVTDMEFVFPVVVMPVQSQ